MRAWFYNLTFFAIYDPLMTVGDKELYLRSNTLNLYISVYHSALNVLNCNKHNKKICNACFGRVLRQVEGI
jgi:hypothetical protein